MSSPLDVVEDQTTFPLLRDFTSQIAGAILSGTGLRERELPSCSALGQTAFVRQENRVQIAI
jgi:hypothetical protein